MRLGGSLRRQAHHRSSGRVVWDRLDHRSIAITQAASREGNKDFRKPQLFEECLERIEAVQDHAIEAACSSLPDDWTIPDDAADRLAAYLRDRRALVRSAIENWLAI